MYVSCYSCSREADGFESAPWEVAFSLSPLTKLCRPVLDFKLDAFSLPESREDGGRLLPRAQGERKRLATSDV